jgi:hypothetical protein
VSEDGVNHGHSAPVLAATVLAAVPLGRPVPGRSRTIDAAEIKLLAAVSELAEPPGSIEDLLQAAGPVELDPHLLLAIVAALGAASPLLRQLAEDPGLTTVAALSHRASSLAPVSGGDTLSVAATISELRPSASKADHYLMTVTDTASNQRGEIVARVDRVLLLRHSAAQAAQTTDAS